MKMFYARVSSKDQNEARQLEDARKVGVEERFIFMDKSTGANFDRDEYQMMVRFLREGDEVYISSLDRLGRNYRETAEAWEHITRDLKAHIIVLDMPTLDTREASDTTAQLIQDIVLKLLCYISERELENIRTRQREGIALARAKGLYTGRKKKQVDKSLFVEMCREIAAGERTTASACRELGLAPATFYRIKKEYTEKTGRWKE